MRHLRQCRQLHAVLAGLVTGHLPLIDAAWTCSSVTDAEGGLPIHA
jgi:hypothetical protein